MGSVKPSGRGKRCPLYRQSRNKFFPKISRVSKVHQRKLQRASKIFEDTEDSPRHFRRRPHCINIEFRSEYLEFSGRISHCTLRVATRFQKRETAMLSPKGLKPKGSPPASCVRGIRRALRQITGYRSLLEVTGVARRRKPLETGFLSSGRIVPAFRRSCVVNSSPRKL